MRFKRRHGHAESSQNVPLHSHHFQAVHCQRFQFVLFCTRPNDCISKVRNKPVEVAVAVALVSALEECIPQVIISTSCWSESFASTVWLPTSSSACVRRANRTSFLNCVCPESTAEIKPLAGRLKWHHFSKHSPHSSQHSVQLWLTPTL